MPRSNKQPVREKADSIKLPDIEHVATAIYQEKYANAYQAKVKLYPHITSLLKELSRVEAELDFVASMATDMHHKGENAFLAGVGTAAPYLHPLRRLLKDLRSQQNKLLKSVNLSLERKEALKAQSDAAVDDIMQRMS